MRPVLRPRDGQNEGKGQLKVHTSTLVDPMKKGKGRHPVNLPLKGKTEFTLDLSGRRRSKVFHILRPNFKRKSCGIGNRGILRRKKLK